MGEIMGHSIDWVKCFQGEADEKLVLELDEIHTSDIIPLMLHRSFEQFTVYRASGKWLDAIGGDFPENLREVVEENGKTILQNWEQ